VPRRAVRSNRAWSRGSDVGLRSTAREGVVRATSAHFGVHGRSARGSAPAIAVITTRTSAEMRNRMPSNGATGVPRKVDDDSVATGAVACAHVGTYREQSNCDRVVAAGAFERSVTRTRSIEGPVENA